MYKTHLLNALTILTLITISSTHKVGEISDGQIQAPTFAAPAIEAPKGPPPPSPSSIIIAPKFPSAPPAPAKSLLPLLSTNPTHLHEAATTAPAPNTSLPIPTTLPPYPFIPSHPTNPSYPHYTAISISAFPQSRLGNVTAPTVPVNPSGVGGGGGGGGASEAAASRAANGAERGGGRKGASVAGWLMVMGVLGARDLWHFRVPT